MVRMKIKQTSPKFQDLILAVHSKTCILKKKHYSISDLILYELLLFEAQKRCIPETSSYKSDPRFPPKI